MLESAGVENINNFSNPSAPHGRAGAVARRIGTNPNIGAEPVPQSHDMRTFVMYASGFTSNPVKPTLSIMALCVRPATYLMVKGNGEMSAFRICLNIVSICAGAYALSGIPS